MPISVSFDVTKLKKDRFFKGKKGVYADLVLWEVEPDSESAEYGDFIVKQKCEKGEGRKFPILGNAKHFELKNGGKGAKKSRRDRDDDQEEEDEIPF